MVVGAIGLEIGGVIVAGVTGVGGIGGGLAAGESITAGLSAYCA